MGRIAFLRTDICLACRHLVQTSKCCQSPRCFGVGCGGVGPNIVFGVYSILLHLEYIVIMVRLGIRYKGMDSRNILVVVRVV